MANWASANTMPQPSAGTHASRSPRLPSTMNTRTSGTNTASKGVCRPTIDATWFRGRPLTCDSVMMGTAIAPNATGAVFATSATTAARIGAKPSAMSINDVTATGAPKPASASRSAPKQKAMRIACVRWSAENAPKLRRSTSKWPVTTVMLKIHSALTTIHMIGNRP